MPQGLGDFIASLLPLGLLALIVYLVFLRPRIQREKAQERVIAEQRDALAALQATAGDEVAGEPVATATVRTERVRVNGEPAVIVRGVEVSFWDLMAFSVKWVVAAIPAMALLLIVGAILWAILRPSVLFLAGGR
ncbi:MAG: hypothetical protein AB1505_10915 [Candidatus Latescibacterota bacterium]